MGIDKLMAGIMGLSMLGYVGLARVSYGESNNLKDYGIPSVEGLTPYKTKWLDKTKKIPGKETKIEFYKVNDKMVAFYKIADRTYAVGYDADNKKPLDLLLVDQNGNSQYQSYPVKKPFLAPEWIANNK